MITNDQIAERVRGLIEVRKEFLPTKVLQSRAKSVTDSLQRALEKIQDLNYNLGKEYRKNGYELPFPLDGIRIEEVRCLLEGAILNRDVVEEHRAGIVSNYSTVVDRRMSDIESEGLPDEYS
jgi:hypothetical protein